MRGFQVIPESVSSKRSFSVGGQTISKDRCNLHTETARELMCVKSWIKFKFEKSDLWKKYIIKSLWKKLLYDKNKIYSFKI